MKALLAAMAFIVSATVSAGTFEYMTGDKIHFQKDSTWVNSYYSKTICLNDNDTYEAVVTVCTKYDSNHSDANCTQYGKKRIFQPMVSTRLRCADWGRENCNDWERVAYVQSPKRTVKFFDRGDQLVNTVTYTIKSCSGATAGK